MKKSKSKTRGDDQTEGYFKLIRGQPSKSKRRSPLWEGPDGGGRNGGVTQSLLSRFIVCRERFRIHAVEGLHQSPTFNHRIEYGSMWHVCEEAYAIARPNGEDDPYNCLRQYCQGLAKKYPTQQEQVWHWYNICRTQFPAYVEYWAKHPDVRSRQPLLQEQAFDVPYVLPSGRAVRLRGK